MSKPSEFDRDYADEQIQRAKNPMRRWLKGFYLDQILMDVQGRAIDFGCGAGQILERLPLGSTGIEINPTLVEALCARGLDVRAYDAMADDFSFTGFDVDRYRTLIVSHVLEHFSDSSTVMRKMWRGCAEIGVDTIIAVVPGKKGFARDATHKTLITESWLRDNDLMQCEGFSLIKINYFPVNVRAIGDYLWIHEMKLLYSRKAFS